MRELNKKGLNLIKKLEGVVPFVYLCQAGKLTIGCGHLCMVGDSYLNDLFPNEIRYMIRADPNLFKVDNYKVESSREVKEMTTITDKEINKLLMEDVADSCRAVEELITANLNDNQFSALVSFTFNLGRGALQKSTLRKKLNQGKYSEVPDELNKWVYANGKVLDVLIKRRKAEGLLFLQNPIFI